MSTRLQWVVAGLVGLGLGVAVGGLPARGQLRLLEEARLEAKQCNERGIGTELVTALHKNALMSPAPRERSPVAEPEQGGDEPAEEEEDEGGGVQFEWNIGEDDEPSEMAEALGDIKTVKSALRLRRRAAWGALEEDVAPSDDQMDAMESAVATMNDDLRDLAEGFLDMADSGELSRRDGLAFTADLMDVFIEADDALYGALDEEQHDLVQEESVDPFSYLDPELIDLFSQLGELEGQ
jgi:hypothetical protein